MKKTCYILGWVILVLVSGVMLLAGSGKVFGFAPEEIVKGLEESRLSDQIVLIGIAEMVSAIFLLIPRTYLNSVYSPPAPVGGHARSRARVGM